MELKSSGAPTFPQKPDSLCRSMNPNPSAAHVRLPTCNCRPLTVKFAALADAGHDGMLAGCELSPDMVNVTAAFAGRNWVYTPLVDWTVPTISHVIGAAHAGRADTIHIVANAAPMEPTRRIVSTS